MYAKCERIGVVCCVCAVLLNHLPCSLSLSRVFSVYPVFPTQATVAPVNVSKSTNLSDGSSPNEGHRQSELKPFDMVANADPHSKIAAEKMDREETAWTRAKAKSTEIEEDSYLAEERESCERNSIISCWAYNVMSLVRTLLQPVASSAALGRGIHSTSPQLVTFPLSTNLANLTLLGRSWDLGNMYFFVENQLARFIEGHGVMFSATTSWEEAVADHFQTPVVIDNGNDRDLKESNTVERKTKKKSVIFPLLVLFKFFKIKMLLIPILISILMVKKLLIVTLALAPNIAGFFRLCRPQLGSAFGLASTGLLQDVSDSRGEFSHVYNTYANPYRDYHGHRIRDLARYTETPSTSSQMPSDY